LEAAWPLTGVSLGEALPGYPTRGVFRVHCDQGDFVAKVDPAPRPDLADVDQLHVLEHLSARGFAHAPALLRTRSRQRTAPIGGSAVSLLEFIPLAVEEGVSIPETWRQLGDAAARLNAFADYPLPFAIQVATVFDQLAARVRSLPFEARFLEVLARAAEIEYLPSDALVHGEINHSNARRRANGTVALVDWDQAGRAPRALEYGYPLITVFLAADDHTFDDRSARAFYAGYVEAGGVIDRRQMFNAALFHALRYMWWGATERRWERILHALSREADICDVIP
jgi:Ser/Thr protein kinase RdoA (MazF antagonist)